MTVWKRRFSARPSIHNFGGGFLLAGKRRLSRNDMALF